MLSRFLRENRGLAAGSSNTQQYFRHQGIGALPPRVVQEVGAGGGTRTPTTFVTGT
jgi:hypothetical protein